MSTTPSEPKRPRRAVRPQAARDDAPLIPDRSAEDTDAAWGDERTDSNDDRLLRDVPPHW